MHIFYKTIIWLILYLYTGVSATFAAPLVKIAISDFPPYADQQAAHFGMFPQIISRAFALQGYKIQLIFVPWADNYFEAQKNDFDAAAFWYCTDERSEIFYCSETLYDEQTVFFYRKNNPLIDWQGLHDFEKRLIGVTQGYSYTDDFWFLVKTGALQVDIAQSEQQNMARLLKREIDVFPMPLMAGQYLLKTQFDQSEQQQITHHTKALTENTHHLLFLKRHKNSRRLRVDFNKGLSELRKSGEYQKIVDQYLQR